MSFDDWRQRQAESAAMARARVRQKQEGPRCKKCGYIGYSCICQINLKEYREFGGTIDFEEFERNKILLEEKRIRDLVCLMQSINKEG